MTEIPKGIQPEQPQSGETLPLFEGLKVKTEEEQRQLAAANKAEGVGQDIGVLPSLKRQDAQANLTNVTDVNKEKLQKSSSERHETKTIFQGISDWAKSISNKLKERLFNVNEDLKSLREHLLKTKTEEWDKEGSYTPPDVKGLSDQYKEAALQNKNLEKMKSGSLLGEEGEKDEFDEIVDKPIELESSGVEKFEGDQVKTKKTAEVATPKELAKKAGVAKAKSTTLDAWKNLDNAKLRLVADLGTGDCGIRSFGIGSKNGKPAVFELQSYGEDKKTHKDKDKVEIKKDDHMTNVNDKGEKVLNVKTYVRAMIDDAINQVFRAQGFTEDQINGMSKEEKENAFKDVDFAVNASSWARTSAEKLKKEDPIIEELRAQAKDYPKMTVKVLSQADEASTAASSVKFTYDHAGIEDVNGENTFQIEGGQGSSH